MRNGLVIARGINYTYIPFIAHEFFVTTLSIGVLIIAGLYTTKIIFEINIIINPFQLLA